MSLCFVSQVLTLRHLHDLSATLGVDIDVAAYKECGRDIGVSKVRSWPIGVSRLFVMPCFILFGSELALAGVHCRTP